MLNLLAVILSLRPIFAPLLARAGRTIEANVPLAAIPTAILAALLLAGFVAAAMMIFASFARTFKEGQAMVTPFYMLVLVPVVFLQAPGLKFSLALALLPVINVTLMVREAFSGHFLWGPSLLTVLVSLVTIALCVRLAAFVLKFEDVVTGSYSGSFLKFMRERLLARRRLPAVVSEKIP
jgi:sodium transport system permease protein